MLAKVWKKTKKDFTEKLCWFESCRQSKILQENNGKVFQKKREKKERKKAISRLAVKQSWKRPKGGGFTSFTFKTTFCRWGKTIQRGNEKPFPKMGQADIYLLRRNINPPASHQIQTLIQKWIRKILGQIQDLQFHELPVLPIPKPPPLLCLYPPG